MVQLLQFFDHVDDFLEKRPNGLIGVHGTKGVNRPGYLIARYLIENFSWDPKAAIKVSIHYLNYSKRNYRISMLTTDFMRPSGNFIHLLYLYSLLPIENQCFTKRKNNRKRPHY